MIEDSLFDENDFDLFGPEDKLNTLGENVEKDAIQKRKVKVLVVDDDKDIHTITHLTLSDFEADQWKVDLIDAYSGKEAIEIVSNTNDVMIILLDIVMETEHAGLDVVKYIREELLNEKVKIVVRTGQAGQLTEESVKKGFAINGFQHKASLTANQLKTELKHQLEHFI
ncbi:MAG: response regulator [Salibacteraceae bacterium]|jgi:CheY-like chemotaxis protein|nr:response regulator [Salibacteraceae bacterium]MDP4685275.1 response regulator [Salibacteraceae bacterium]MDP4763093.1 response regulator [Salibacteraceae bacterium]MDP4843456.1 response regulator [Salibacteraceae bacterium]MDP4934055.1 response regulator [Salibacteraceae bacterium]